MLDKQLLEILVCPICKGRLEYNQLGQALICHSDQLAFPIKDGIPVMLREEAKPLYDRPDPA